MVADHQQGPVHQFVVEAPTLRCLDHRLRQFYAAISIRKGQVCAVTHTSHRSNLRASVVYRLPIQETKYDSSGQDAEPHAGNSGNEARRSTEQPEPLAR